MSTHLKGIAASKGIVIAKAFVLKNPEIEVETKKTDDPEKELDRLETVIRQSEEELQNIQDHATRELGQDHAEIFAAHLLVLNDPEFIGPMKEKITSEHQTAESAVDEVSKSFISIFENMDNEYMKERSADIRDVSGRLLAHLLNIDFTTPAAITEEAIIIAKDLTPSDTAQLNRQFVKGFATEIGGRTSHSAIMARSMEIPAIVGTGNITEQVEHQMTVILDGIEGLVIVDPTSEEISEYKSKEAEFRAEQQQLKQLMNEKTVTKDGKHVDLAANIGSPDDLEAALSNGAEGIGLYRTEFLYMGRDRLPDEEEQYEAYKVVLEKMADKPVVIRTLDIGGDKKLPYLDLPEELNPFLGFRAIRLCLEKQNMFRTQLRALLRASIYGRLHIMFPMIATVDEFKQAKQITMEEKENLRQRGIEVSDDVKIGMMVEIPAAAVMAKAFAKEVDFFSIGTNDLIQYTMAADRMNERVSYLYQPFSPAVLNLIKHVISAAHTEGKWVGMCGEMAGDEMAAPLLLGLGLDEFSMSASSILSVRKLFKQLDVGAVAKHSEKVLSMNSNDEVIRYLQQSF